MSDVPIQLLVAAFKGEHDADQVLKELKAAKRVKVIGIQNAAVMRRDQKGKLHIKETGDWGGGKGAAAGAAIGVTLGILTGGTGLLAGAAAAAIGGVAAKLRDSGFDDVRLRTLGESLQPGTSAIVAVIEHTWVADMEKQMTELGADVFTAALAADIGAQLEAGREVAYTALAGQEGIAMGRVSAGDDDVEADGVVALA
jgi:uncharacterized membrane protein